MSVLQRAGLPVDQNGNPYEGGDQTTINANTAGIQLATGPCFLHTVNLTKPGTTWVLDLYDGISATGTPIEFVSALPGSFQFYSKFLNGIYAVASGGTAGSATITYSSQTTT